MNKLSDDELEKRVLRLNEKGITPTMMGIMRSCPSGKASEILKKYGLLKKRGIGFKRAYKY